MGVTLAQAKTRLGVSGSADDALLTSLIQGATSRVERILNRNIRQGRYREVIEQDYRDETLLLPGGGPFAAPVVTANGGAVALTTFDPKIGEIGIIPAGASRAVFGALEAQGALSAYQVTFRRGWLLDEGAINDAGLVEEFELLSEALNGETEIVLDAADLADGSKLPDGATLSLGDEILFVATSTRDGDELTATLMQALLDDHAAGDQACQVDERVPAVVQDEILALVGDAYRTQTGASTAVPADISEVEGDGYRLKTRDPKEVDDGIRLRLRDLVVIR